MEAESWGSPQPNYLDMLDADAPWRMDDDAPPLVRA
jgi:hypothetical protein